MFAMIDADTTEDLKAQLIELLQSEDIMETLKKASQNNISTMWVLCGAAYILFPKKYILALGGIGAYFLFKNNSSKSEV